MDKCTIRYGDGRPTRRAVPSFDELRRLKVVCRVLSCKRGRVAGRQAARERALRVGKPPRRNVLRAAANCCVAFR